MLAADRLLRSGKVRDIGRMDDGRILLIASDRISAFDVVLPTEIPDKGRVLTGLSRFWFRETAPIVENHLLATDPTTEAGRLLGDDEALPGTLAALLGRLMICRPATVVPIEAVVRGYLSGSGWKEYEATGAICGIRLPSGLRESDALPEPIFTPAEKAPAGRHDRNLTFDEMIEHLSTSHPESQWPFDSRSLARELGDRIRHLAIRLYRHGAAVAARSGVLLADTKFEFGIPTDRASDDAPPAADRLMLIDEVMTPDSSRFWDAATYAPGGSQRSFDKQFVRDWLERQAWDKTAPGPELPADVVAGTRARYVEAYERITGSSFDRYLREDIVG
jgi:phosphoribosylaminoimidazole-succinocarboxamide synthase